MPLINKIFRFFRIDSKPGKLAPYRPRKLITHFEGEHYNLKELYDEVNSKYFENQLDLRITWAGNRNSKPRTRVMFGSYCQERKLIKIHRRLDQSHIPIYFISFVVYHEMLHHLLPPIKGKNRKKQIHHPAFIQKEKQFQEYDLAIGYIETMKTTWFRW